MASEAWIEDKVLHIPSYRPFLAGTLGIAIRRGEIPGLREFLLRIRPDNDLLRSQNNNIVGISPNLLCFIGTLLNIYVISMLLMFPYEPFLFIYFPSLGEAVLGACISVQVRNPWHGV